MTPLNVIPMWKYVRLFPNTQYWFTIINEHVSTYAFTSIVNDDCC